jgi:putative chitinase
MDIQLTDEQFRLIAPTVGPAKRAQLLPALNAAMLRFGITTRVRVAAFVANLLKESEGFRYAREIWGPTPTQERYEGRKDLGNTQPGDGEKFMGRGYIQTTGRANYARVGKALGLDLLDHPELLEQTDNACLSAAFFWSDKHLNELADCLRGVRDAAEQRTLTSICRRINGGTNGLAERVQNYWRCLAVLDRAPSAVTASQVLAHRIAASPVIPTPETHDPIELKIADKSPEVQAQAEAAHVAEQSKAASYIDLAEATPSSAIAEQSKSLWAKSGSRVVEAGAWLGSALKAGELSAYLLVAVLALFLLYVAWRNRADLRRWAVVALSAAKEGALAS